MIHRKIIILLFLLFLLTLCVWFGLKQINEKDTDNNSDSDTIFVEEWNLYTDPETLISFEVPKIWIENPIFQKRILTRISNLNPRLPFGYSTETTRTFISYDKEAQKWTEYYDIYGEVFSNDGHGFGEVPVPIIDDNVNIVSSTISSSNDLGIPKRSKYMYFVLMTDNKSVFTINFPAVAGERVTSKDDIIKILESIDLP